MDFTPDTDLASFRQEVRQFLAEKLPDDLKNLPWEMRSPRTELTRWQRILADRGWGAPGWALEDGGTGWTIQQCLAFEEECALAGTPSQDPFAQKLLGPVLNRFGTPEQKAEHISPILRGDRLWCQGFSEAGSGSDLASLRTKAERNGDVYVVNGHKLWTSFAHQADWIFLLVRTDPHVRKQAGISFLLVDMRSPGITVRPIISIDGRHHLNQVFFDDVRVPIANRIGDEGEGWAITKFLLNHEHASTADLPALRGYIRQLRELAPRLHAGGRPLTERSEFVLRLAKLEAELEAIVFMVARVAAMEQDHSPVAHAMGSMLKLRGTELQQRITSFMTESLGDFGAISTCDGGDAAAAFPFLPDFAQGIARETFFRRAATIYGGSSEVQRGIIAKSMFNL